MLLKRLIIIIALFFVGNNSAYSRSCEGDRINWNFGETVEFKQKVKVNAICSRNASHGSAGFVGSEMIEYPKGIFQVVERPYEFAFRISKVGKYSIKYRYKLVDRYGKEQYVTFVMNVDVVENEW
jgi:hypothetical protein